VSRLTEDESDYMWEKRNYLYDCECNVSRLTEDESDYLWEKRNYLYDYPSALPRMIQVCIICLAGILWTLYVYLQLL